MKSHRRRKDEIRDEPLPGPSDHISAEDVFPQGGPAAGAQAYEEDDWDEKGGRLAQLPGPLIAAITFVPTFLAVFLGLSYLLGGVTPTARRANAPVPSAVAPLSGQLASPLSEQLRDPFVAPRPIDPPRPRLSDPRDVTRPRDPREALRAPSPEEATPPAVEPASPPALPTLPSQQPRAGPSPAPEPRAPRLAEPPQQSQPAAPEPPPTRAARPDGRDWAPAAAFTDGEAAKRLASSIQQQGYPVEIRQDPSSTRPWVVWIGTRPRSSERRR